MKLHLIRRTVAAARSRRSRHGCGAAPALLLLALLVGPLAGLALPARFAEAQGEPPWQVRQGAGLRFEYAPEDRALADRLWPVLQEDRKTVMERLRMFPPDELRVVLAPTQAVFERLLGGAPSAGTLGVYRLGEGLIVLRSPRTDLGGQWDLRGVLRHELAHAIIDAAVAQPIPLWLHEGLAILVSDDLGYLDEAELTTVAVLGRLIPLPVLFDQFPRTHGARTLAYAQAASFVRFLLRVGGMGGLQRLLERLAQGAPPQAAFAATYGEELDSLEGRWQGELSGRFSTLTLVTTSSVLGGLGIPLLLLAVLRRRLQRRAAYRQMEQEERLLAAVRGEPPRTDGTSPEPSNGGPALRDGWN